VATANRVRSAYAFVVCAFFFAHFKQGVWLNLLTFHPRSVPFSPTYTPDWYPVYA
jgi:hypothetical protein